MPLESEILQGSLDLLVLKRLSAGPMHGWGIAQDIQLLSGDALKVGQGSLYPALHRLEKQRLITSDWDTTDNNRRAKFYRLTTAGRKALAQEIEDWRRFTDAVELILSAQ
ncbi:MAG TPA: PadR family transcriptional regulator [Gemmatimonadaceae bacterium]|nr:PadR family transcriptional regulator [Gemmatimonadaceae bacterium]